jgi:CheY-like chemotaxis protein
LDSIAAMLRLSGFEVRSARNGAIGLEEVITFHPDVVLFDFWMPVADGRELLQGIREVARARLGLVAMSGTPEVEDWCGRVGVSQFLRKPFDRERLIEAVSAAYDEARTTSTRMPISSAMPAARRLKVDRAVLVVGDRESVRPVRHLLREGTRPMQVAVVETVEDAVRALSSFSLDAVAVCGHAREPGLATLVAEANDRGLPVVLDARIGDRAPSGPRVLVANEGAAAMVDGIQQVVAGPRARA